MALLTKHHNHQYDGGAPNIPVGVGDRFYGQDLGRDFWYLAGGPGLSLSDLKYAPPCILSCGHAIQGAGDTVSIPYGMIGYVLYAVTVPDTFAALPPAVTTKDVIKHVECPVLTNQAIAAATLDGGTPNYIKIKFKEADLNQRTRQKATGSYYYEVDDSYELVVSAVAPTNYDVCLGSFTGLPAGVFTFDYTTANYNPVMVVSTQNEFNSILRRASANNYSIKTRIKKVQLNYLAAGYNFKDGVTGPLAGGDAYGILSTNACINFTSDGDAFIDVGDTLGYWRTNTDDCIVNGVYIKGNGAVAAAIAYSFLLAANRVVYLRCRTSNRNSDGSAVFAGFNGSGTALNNYTSKYIGCAVYDITATAGASALTAWNISFNIDNCIAYNLTRTTAGAGGVYAFLNCNFLSNTTAYNCSNDRALINVFYLCNNLINCNAFTASCLSGVATGFYTCKQISNCKAESLTGANGSIGYNDCAIITSSYAKTLRSSSSGTLYGFSISENITGCKVLDIQVNNSGSSAYGFNACNQIDGCAAEQIYSLHAGVGSYAIGFFSCNAISGCYATDIRGGMSAVLNTWAFQLCKALSSCRDGVLTPQNGGSANGFASCSYGAALFLTAAANAGNDWMDTTDVAIANKNSTSATLWT